jgi:hypothetical protein
VENHGSRKERKKNQKRKKKKPDGKVENAASILQIPNRIEGVSHFPTGSTTTAKL